MLPFLVLYLVAATTGLHDQDGGSVWETAGHLHADDYTLLHNLHRRSVSTSVPGFKSIFVDASGITSKTRGQTGTQIEIVGSPLTPEPGLEVAADVVAKMTKYMPGSIFKQLATSNSVGVFTAAEKLTIFPEFKHMANGNCGRSCAGSCSQTCTMDGRKWEEIAGVGGKDAAILYDNLMCTDNDPYRKTQNILAHELAHTIHGYALSAGTKQQIKTAYWGAKATSTWKPSSYAMFNELEYFAEGTSAFLYVSGNNEASGGMNFCRDRLCPSLQATREQLRQRDPAFYDILSYVYTDNRPHLTSGLTVCPTSSFLG